MSTSTGRLAALLVLVLCAAPAPALAVPAAEAVVAGCATSAASAATDAPLTGARTRGPVRDTAPAELGELGEVARTLDRAADADDAAEPEQVTVDVHVHVISTRKHRGPTRLRVRKQITVLSKAYAGGQSAENEASPFTFTLRSFERVRNVTWYSARIGSTADQQMRRRLHRGNRADLNVYVLQPRLPRDQGNQQLLGWSTFPWSGAASQDGISLHQASLPGGKFTGFDLGDTLVHETGHWLGLLHTFSGGCTEENDQVEDTPAQASPSDTCVEGTDTCDLPGLDPVHNFMDYPPDACMFMFTPGQVARMSQAWTSYRAPAT